MQRLNRKDINTIDYWNGLYTKGERAGWFHHPKKEGSIKTFFHFLLMNSIMEEQSIFIHLIIIVFTNYFLNTQTK